VNLFVVNLKFHLWFTIGSGGCCGQVWSILGFNHINVESIKLQSQCYEYLLTQCSQEAVLGEAGCGGIRSG
jgi:hypothetical protein